MTAHAQIGPISQQYSAAATVPLIKSPSLWLPRPVELPNDIHPLPEDITAYFVYPFTLEQHVLSIQPSPHDAIAQKRAHLAELLHRREIEEEQREKEALHKMAPGYRPTGLLVPTSSSRTVPAAAPQDEPRHTPISQLPISGTGIEELNDGMAGMSNGMTSGLSATAGGTDPMDDLVSQLENMESRQ